MSEFILSSQPVSDNSDDGVEYRIVPGYPAYRVGDDGSVWTSKYRVGVKGQQGACSVQWLDGGPWKKMKATKADGYLFVSLSNDGPQKRFGVHYLVLIAFVGPRPEGLDVRHLDDVRDNNRRTNLAWGTGVENWADARRNGKVKIGEKHPDAKLKAVDVIEIRRLAKEGMRICDIHKLYPQILETSLWNVIAGRCWKALL